MNIVEIPKQRTGFDIKIEKDRKVTLSNNFYYKLNISPLKYNRVRVGIDSDTDNLVIGLCDWDNDNIRKLNTNTRSFNLGKDVLINIEEFPLKLFFEDFEVHKDLDFAPVTIILKL